METMTLNGQEVQTKKIDGAGYVYIARLIDYGGNFLGNFHKIGLSKQYKIRETQLNSTHLPVDVLMVRVFETDDMKSVEGLLHLCFHDYRIKKEYSDRRNITTEWFDVDDIDDLNERIDKFVPLYRGQLKEIDVVSKINSDKEVTIQEKNELAEVVRKSKTVLHFKYKGEELTTKYAADTFALAISKIADYIGWDKLDNEEDYVTKDINELKERYMGSYKDTAVKQFNNHYIWTGFDNQQKLRCLNKHIRLNNIPDMEVWVYP